MLEVIFKIVSTRLLNAIYDAAYGEMVKREEIIEANDWDYTPLDLN